MTDNNNNNGREKALQWLNTTAKFTHSQLRANSGLPTGATKAFIKRLLHNKAIKCIKKRDGNTPAKYKVIDLSLLEKEPEVDTPVQTNGRKQAWCWILTNPYFSSAELVKNVGIKKALANNFIAFLKKEKRIKCTTKRRGSIGARYKLVDNKPITFGTGNRVGQLKTTAKTSSKQQKMWNAIRIFNKFTLANIAAGTNTSTKVVGTYVNALAKAGIVRCSHPANKIKNTPAYFRLIKDLGNLSPVRREDCIFDLNAQKAYPFKHVDKASQSTNRRVLHGQQTRMA